MLDADRRERLDRRRIDALEAAIREALRAARTKAP
jgi:hypothetical protein